MGPIFSPKFSSAVAGLSSFAIIPCQSAMSSDPNRNAPALGLLSSTLSSLQGRFAAVSTPVGGTAVARGESLVSSVSSVLGGGSYVLPGGFGGRGPSGATIVESPSVGGSSAYEVMAGFRDQVISPVLDAQMGEQELENKITLSTLQVYPHSLPIALG